MSRHDDASALVRMLRLTGAAAFALALPAVALGAPRGRTAGWVMVAVLVLSSLGRVAYLSARWAKAGDHRFALAGAVLVGVTLAVAAGAAAAG